MFIISVFAEINRTLTNSPRPPVAPSVVPDFHFGIPPGYECTPYSPEHEAVKAFNQPANQHEIVRPRTGPWPLKRPAELPVMLSPFAVILSEAKDLCSLFRVKSAKHFRSSLQAAEPKKQLQRSFASLRMTDDFKLRIWAKGGMQSALPRHAKLLRAITSFQARVRATVQHRFRILFERRR